MPTKTPYRRLQICATPYLRTIRNRLGLDADQAATDFGTGEPVPNRGGRLILKLRKHDFRTTVIAD